MNNYFNGLSVVNIELTSRCNKSCWMCGRRKLELKYPELCNYGDIEFDLLEKIAKQIPENILIQFHNNGEPLLYSKLREALDLFSNNIKCLNTNGKLLISKSWDIMDILDTVTISVIENDSESDEQYEIVNEFLKIKGQRKPFVIFRLLGDVAKTPTLKRWNIIIEKKTRWYDLAKEYNCLIATRILHNPMGSFNYTNKVTIPEHGLCLDLLSHLSISKDGLVSCCVRFDPNKEIVIGDCTKENLIDIWNSTKRQDIINLHKNGQRKLHSFCSKCDFYGCPTSQ